MCSFSIMKDFREQKRRKNGGGTIAWSWKFEALNVMFILYKSILRNCHKELGSNGKSFLIQKH